MGNRWRFVAWFLVGTLPACQQGDAQGGDAGGDAAAVDRGAVETVEEGPVEEAPVEQAPSEEAPAPAAAPMDSAALARVREKVDERLLEIDSAAQRLPGLIASIRRDMRRHLNDDHVAAARKNGVGPVRDSAHMAALVRSGDLVRLPDSTRWWVLRELRQSVPYVTPGTRDALQEIGRRFHARLAERGLPPFRLDITSVLRTSRQQDALRRRNANAADEVSSHQFGTTLDIAYLSFLAPESLDWDSLTPEPDRPLPPPLLSDATARLDSLATRRAPHIEGELGAVLQTLQRDGAVLPLRERGQPVFHITVARDPRGEPAPASRRDGLDRY